jgi:hypothetical protein
MIGRRDSRIAMLYRMRREADGKYAHLWNEYEYYLGKYREAQGVVDKPRGEDEGA